MPLTIPLSAPRGIIPPLVTPLQDDCGLDERGAEHLITHLLKGGVHGLFILGTTGEGPSLSSAVRRNMIHLTCRVAAGRVPVFVGVTDTAAEETLALTAHAADHGASGVVIAPPPYFAAAEPELLHYFEFLRARLALPFFLYNMPALTKVMIDDNLVRQSLEWPECLGLKDSSGQLLWFKRMARLTSHREDYRVLMGPEELLFESLLGRGDGGVCGGANVFPQLYTTLFNAVESGDLTYATLLQNKILDVSDRLYRIGRFGSSTIKGIKCALNCMGICGDQMAQPFGKFRPPERQLVQKALTSLQQEITATLASKRQ
jgi:dihydrodipicolinate synthase/N-acetylneuraminate lyase